MSEMPLSQWYNPRFVANPFFHPSQSLIENCGEETRLSDRSNDSRRRLVLVIDNLPDFTFPLTLLDPITGAVTRVLAHGLKNELHVPADWQTNNNHVVWTDDEAGLEQASLIPSMVGGRLGVPNAWVGTRAQVEFCLENVDRITDYALLRDRHRVTSRWSMRHWRVCCEPNVAGLEIDSHPQKKIGGSNFFVVMPNMVWHPRHNPGGFLQSIHTAELVTDEVYRYVERVGAVVLWDEHATDGSFGACIDPVFLATVWDHSYRRNAEPYFWDKGVSARTDQRGTKPDYYFSSDPDARAQLSFRDILDGGTTLVGRPYDEIIVFGQAGTHCVPEVILDGIDDLYNHGRENQAYRIKYVRTFCQNIPGFEERRKELEAKILSAGVTVVDNPMDVFGD